MVWRLAKDSSGRLGAPAWLTQVVCGFCLVLGGCAGDDKEDAEEGGSCECNNGGGRCPTSLDDWCKEVACPADLVIFSQCAEEGLDAPNTRGYGLKECEARGHLVYRAWGTGDIIGWQYDEGGQLVGRYDWSDYGSSVECGEVSCAIDVFSALDALRDAEEPWGLRDAGGAGGATSDRSPACEGL